MALNPSLSFHFCVHVFSLLIVAGSWSPLFATHQTLKRSPCQCPREPATVPGRGGLTLRGTRGTNMRYVQYFQRMCHAKVCSATNYRINDGLTCYEKRRAVSGIRKCTLDMYVPVKSGHVKYESTLSDAFRGTHTPAISCRRANNTINYLVIGVNQGVRGCRGHLPRSCFWPERRFITHSHTQTHACLLCLARFALHAAAGEHGSQGGGQKSVRLVNSCPCFPLSDVFPPVAACLTLVP